MRYCLPGGFMPIYGAIVAREKGLKNAVSGCFCVFCENNSAPGAQIGPVINYGWQVL
jgi:hypothetical protein